MGESEGHGSWRSVSGIGLGFERRASSVAIEALALSKRVCCRMDLREKTIRKGDRMICQLHELTRGKERQASPASELCHSKLDQASGMRHEKNPNIKQVENLKGGPRKSPKRVASIFRVLNSDRRFGTSRTVNRT